MSNWIDFNFYFNAQPTFFKDKFVKDNPEKFAFLKDKFGFINYEDLLKDLSDKYTEKFNRTFEPFSKIYKQKKRAIEDNIVSYCLQNCLGSKKYNEIVEKELDKELLTNKSIELQYSRILDNFNTFIKSPEYLKTNAALDNEMHKYIKDNYNSTFVNKQLSVPGTLIKVKREDVDDTFVYLIGDVNPTGSFTNDRKGLYISNNSIIIAYKVLEINNE